MTNTEKQIFDYIELEARKKYGSVNKFLNEKKLNTSTYSKHKKGKQNMGAKYLLKYLKLLDVKLTFESGFDGTKKEITITDQIDMF